MRRTTTDKSVANRSLTARREQCCIHKPLRNTCSIVCSAQESKGHFDVWPCVMMIVSVHFWYEIVVQLRLLTFLSLRNIVHVFLAHQLHELHLWLDL